jgi:hypothetical protein
MVHGLQLLVAVARRLISLCGRSSTLSMLVDARRQVAGHHLFDLFFDADDTIDLAGALGKKDGSLTGRVAAADDHDWLVDAELSLDGGGAVVDAAPFVGGAVMPPAGGGRRRQRR